MTKSLNICARAGIIKVRVVYLNAMSTTKLNGEILCLREQFGKTLEKICEKVSGVLNTCVALHDVLVSVPGVRLASYHRPSYSSKYYSGAKALVLQSYTYTIFVLLH